MPSHHYFLQKRPNYSKACDKVFGLYPAVCRISLDIYLVRPLDHPDVETPFIIFLIIIRSKETRRKEKCQKKGRT